MLKISIGNYRTLLPSVILIDFLFQTIFPTVYLKISTFFYTISFIFVAVIFETTENSCVIPVIMRNQWFSWERGKETFTEFRPDSMSNRGTCVDLKREHLVNYTFVFQNRENDCFYCVKILVRTVNVLEKMESA